MQNRVVRVLVRLNVQILRVFHPRENLRCSHGSNLLVGTRLSNDKKEEQEVLDHIKYKIVTKAGLLGRGTYPSINDSIENPSGWLKPVMLARLIQRVHVMKQGFCAIGCGAAFPTSGPCIRCEENGRKDIEEKAKPLVRAIESVKKAGNTSAVNVFHRTYLPWCTF